jgi:hypothetical protein
MQSAATYSASNPTVIPDGGLATFLTATEGRWAQDNPWADEYDDLGPTQGIGSVKQVADKIAEFGRNEDTYIVHAAHGETVIPMEVLDADPRLKARLFSQMKGMGIEPERYIVGSELNSINPVTGQPEFFLKKLVSSVWKGVKKVFRTAAQIVLPIVGGIMLGPIGAFAGSYAGTLIAGGNSAQALKAAKIAGITQGVFQAGSAAVKAAGAASQAGVAAGAPLTAGQKLAAGLKGGISSIGQGLGLASGPNYLQQFTGGIGGFLKPVQGGGFNLDTLGKKISAAEAAAGKYQAALNPYADTLLQPVLPTTVKQPPIYPSMNDLLQEVDVLGTKRPPLTATTNVASQVAPPAAGAAAPELKELDLSSLPQKRAMPNWDKLAYESMVDKSKLGSAGYLERLRGEGGFFDTESLGNLKDMILGGKDLQTTQANIKRAEAYLKSQGTDPADILKTINSLKPKLLQKWGPAAMVALGLAATQEAEQPEMPQITTGWDVYRPNIHGIQQPDFGGYGASFAPAQGGGQMAGMVPPPTFAKGGGMYADFPRRDGPIYGPGTETSDDIPAMLSDGEFVMTARAVRGAGDGDRKRGMQRMYNIMNAFEGGAV